MTQQGPDHNSARTIVKKSGEARGMTYGRYRVMEEVGSGAMGIVYKAHDPRIDRMVALKVLKKQYVDDDYFVRRFFKEAVAIGRLSHPNIVTVYDIGKDRGSIYIAMELLEGDPLDELVKSKRLTPDQVHLIGIQAAEALDYASRKGVVHRDIKPANILVDSDFRVKITDFGVAHIEDVTITKQTQVGDLMGTPYYMSPEQISGEIPDGRSDLYSLGVVLYELLTGKTPVRGNTMPAIYKSVSEETPTSPISLDATIPKCLSDTVMKSLEKKTIKRFQSGAEMAAAMKTCMTEVNSHAHLPPWWTKKGYWLLGVMILSFAGVLGGYFFKETPTKKSEPPPVIEPIVEKATLKIATDPPAADAYLDGKFKGKTPLSLELDLGKYEVKLQMAEHFDWEAQVDLNEKGKTEALDVKLHSTSF